MAAKLYLKAVTDANEGDAILSIGTLPFMRGKDDENLACGACRQVIFRGVSTRTVYEKFGTSAGTRLIARCPCGRDNLLPSSQSE